MQVVGHGLQIEDYKGRNLKQIFHKYKFNTMKQDENNSKHYVADDGKVFRRKYDRQVFGSELYLGFTYYLGDTKLYRGIPEYI